MKENKVDLKHFCDDNKIKKYVGIVRNDLRKRPSKKNCEFQQIIERFAKL